MTAFAHHVQQATAHLGAAAKAPDAPTEGREAVILARQDLIGVLVPARTPAPVTVAAVVAARAGGTPDLSWLGKSAAPVVCGTVEPDDDDTEEFDPTPLDVGEAGV